MAQLLRPPASLLGFSLTEGRPPTADHDGSRRRRSRGGAGDERGAPGLLAALLRPPHLPLQLLLTANRYQQVTPRALLRAFRHTPSLHCLLVLTEETLSGHGMICTLLNFDSVFSGPSGDNDGVGGGGSELAAATSGSCKL